MTKSMESSSSPSSLRKNNLNTISPQLWPIFRILRLFGAYPIIMIQNPVTLRHISPSENGAGVHQRPFGQLLKEEAMMKEAKFQHRYHHQQQQQWPRWICAFSREGLTSFIFWYTLAMCSINLFIWVTGVFNIGFDLPIPLRLLHFKDLNYSSPYIQFLTRATHIVEILTKLFEFVAVLSNIPVLVKFLNSWPDFEKKFHQTFPNTNNNDGGGGAGVEVDVTIFRNFVFTLFVCPLTLCWAVTCCFGVYPTLEAKSVFATLCILWTTCLMGVYSLVEDTKLFVVLRTIEKALEKVKFAILNEKRQRLSSLKPADVTKWHCLIRQVRRQCDLVEEWVGSQQLVLLIQTILLNTGYLYAILNFLGERSEVIIENLGYLLACIAVCVNLLGRVYLRTVLADRIYKEDRAIASELIEMALETSDSQLQAELKSTSQTMAQLPIQIRFGNYVVLDKPLLTKIFVQVLTYLIIILQFANSNK